MYCSACLWPWRWHTTRVGVVLMLTLVLVNYHARTVLVRAKSGHFLQWA